MFELALRIGFSLFVILGMMWLLARLIRRPLGRGHGALVVLNRQQLTRGAAVAVVRVADRAMILGVTDQNVSLLGEADVEDFEKHPHEHRDHLPVGPDLTAAEAASLSEPLPGRHPAAQAPGRLEGSLLSPRTWSQTMSFLRDRTTRR
ncbi:flagellar biosynthetic protein FliO [Paractinoplanes atraurantiacus]|uniref:Flagellar protein FliO/FliZ n=1 Tax=Paractinoplanes atraurantiacus TaxID=1036182 RepID=A0A285F1E4_9ACTN|nr:flagellar biosynthetic protein FliO [Actinoplanes atraurantiacus]SNY05092.1 flagellar protein FliO/FliZ [Actinoplanes atraurantiacus]